MNLMMLWHNNPEGLRRSQIRKICIEDVTTSPDKENFYREFKAYSVKKDHLYESRWSFLFYRK